MCLVSYIPNQHGYILSSNRDEFRDRNAKIVQKVMIADELVSFPMDPMGGSWIMVSDRHRVVCLLNGAFENHQRQLPYRHSRGLVMKAFFQYEDAIHFFEKYDLNNIEPFTMIIIEAIGLFEFRWDGIIKHVNKLELDRIYIWSSSTLYEQPVRKQRAKKLSDELNSINKGDPKAVLAAHLTKDETDLWNGLVMNREGIVQTISHTQVVSNGKFLSLKYLNLLDDQVFESSI